MSAGLSDATISVFVNEINSLLQRASSLAKVSAALSAQGLRENAIDTLLDIEPMLHEATTLLNATSLVNRRFSAQT